MVVHGRAAGPGSRRLGVTYGLTVTLREGRVGDISYHFSVLALSLATLVLLLVPKTREDLRPKA